MSPERLSVLLLSLLMAGCVTIPSDAPRQLQQEIEEYDLQMLAKSDMSRVAELGQREVLDALRSMMIALYAANPEQLKRGRSATVRDSVERIFGERIRWDLPEFGSVKGNQLLGLPFDSEYRGDRVLAFTAALVSMTMRAYNGTTQLYLLDRLSPQKIYHSARNFETAAEMVRRVKQRGGAPYLREQESDLSRLLGRAAAVQDLMATLVADQTNRRITGSVHSVTAMVVLPI